MNIASKITRNAYLYPHKKALYFASKNGQEIHYENLTFKELESYINQYALHLKELGVSKGDKVLLLIRPSLIFAPLIFSLFKIGAVVILMDKGAGILKLLSSIRHVKPKVLIGEPSIFLLRFFYRPPFRSIHLCITNKRFYLPGVLQLNSPKKTIDAHYQEKHTLENDTAAILFTSGATGNPKGVVYTHAILLKQIEILKDMFNLSENDLDVAAFPLFSLFTLSMGMSSVLPPMDFSMPAKSDPKILIQLIQEIEGTFLSGSPAVWQKVADYCDQRKITLPSVKVLATFGAPVAIDLHKKFKGVLINGTTYTPYGATECLPACNISGKEILSDTAVLTEKGKGVCVGRPPSQMEVEIIQPTNEPVEDIALAKILSPYEIGEIIVRGPVTTASYYNMPQNNLHSKIMDDNTFWHRMGDMGYLDLQGRLWFCGRKSHLVITAKKLLYTTPCESIFNRHPAVKRSALIGLGKTGKQTPAIVIEREKRSSIPARQLNEELLKEASLFVHTRDIKYIYYRRKLPVDLRHNIKIDRLKLKNEIERSYH